VDKNWVVYLVQCSDGSLYCGITNDLKKRLSAHNSGSGAKYTRSRRPVKLVGTSSKLTKTDALKLEYQVKKVPAEKKISELKKGEGTMAKEIEKDLMALAEQMKMVAKRIEKLTEAIGDSTKASSTKPKTVRKKAPVKKRAAAKKSSPKKPAKKTDRGIVLGFIQRAKKGIDTATLAKKTGFSPKKIANIVFQLKKQGKIQSPEKGVYSKA
jgi:putative endonuclease